MTGRSHPSAARTAELLHEPAGPAGDHIVWSDPLPAAEPQPFPFWACVAIALTLSLIAWGLLTAIGFTVYGLFTSG